MKQQSPLSRGRKYLLAGVFIAITVLTLAAEGYAGLRGWRNSAQLIGTVPAVTVGLGKAAALCAGILIMFQFAMSARLKLLDKIFGIDRLLRMHAITGASAMCLAVLHPMLLYGSKVYQLGTLQLSLWPQLAGAAALILLAIIVTTTLGRSFLELKYESWRHIHELAFAAVVVVTIHGLALGSDFTSDWPVFLWFAVTGGYAAVFIWVKFINPVKLKRELFTVSDVTQLNHNTYNLSLKATGEKVFAYEPGQFAFLRLYRKGFKAEQHPFTISSCQDGSDSLSFTIKQSGDYTKTIGQTMAGDKATVDGPYGRFSYKMLCGFEEIVMIAGGVGITPFLSGLRDMARTGFDRKVTLIWANQTEKDIFLNDELAAIQRSLPNLRIIHVMSKQDDYKGRKGYVGEKLLRELGGQGRAGIQVMLCGPPIMMKLVSDSLRKVGFSRCQIHTERFSL